MRQLLLISLVCICAPALPGQERKQAWPPEIEQQAREVLNGRNVTARIYLDPQADPSHFERISIPVIEGLIKLSTIKSAYPFLSDAATTLIWARDQTDTTVAETLGRHVYMSRYMEKSESSLRFLAAYNDYSPQWTFLDARGEPIPRASVKVAACAYNAMGDVPLYEATLDEQGRLPRLLGALFLFTVEHPDYGAAEVFYMHSQDDPCGVYVVPLVPRNSDDFAAAARGNVIDSDGNPVSGVRVTCSELVKPDGTREYPYQRILGRAVTDTKGWFALCLPTVTKDFELKDLPPIGTQYFVEIEPPKVSTLRGLEGNRPAAIPAGSQRTFTLPKMDAKEFFHTFAFEYQEGPITNLEELKSVRLALWRDNREWRKLTYEQWKDGCLLPPGELRASITRWGDQFGFPHMGLTADSPVHLVLRAGPLILFRGRVVDAFTGKSLPGAFVLSGHQYARKDPCSLTDDQWRQLQTEAARQAADHSPRALHQWRDRVAVTDVDGRYEMAFMPGFGDQLSSFSAMAPGYDRAGCGGGFPASADGSVEVPTIRLPPRNGQSYFPTFLFENETGPVTDPAKLKDIKLEIRCSDGVTHMRRYEELSSKRQFTPGVYHAEVVWDRKHYTFEPVNLSQSRPEKVTFRPANIENVDVIHKGTVVHGITGRPVAGAAVLYRRVWTGRDASGLTREQWTAIRALGPHLDATDPALAPLMGLFVHPGVPPSEMIPFATQTDSNGKFVLSSDLSNRRPTDQLLAIAPDFLGAVQQLEPMMRPEADPTGRLERRRLEADENGVINIPPMRLFPAATVLIHPVLPDPGDENTRQRLRLQWTAPRNEEPSWTQAIHTIAKENRGASVFYVYDLRPNVPQSLYVPAETPLMLSMSLLPEMVPPPIQIGTVRLKQGEVTDLGRVEFLPSVQVGVRVIDDEGAPVPGVRIDCVYDDGFQWMAPTPANAEGIVTLSVPAHSAGRFRIAHYDRQTETLTEESTPYTVAGEEDTGKVFTLRLSDALIERLREWMKATRGALPAGGLVPRQGE